MLSGKKITLVVTGGVSFYKAYEVLSLLKKNGANVRVAMTPGALKFASPLGFEALSGSAVLFDGGESWSAGVSHIEFGRADAVVVVPATANSLNKLACGVADNAALQTVLASSAPKVVAPAANFRMLENPATVRSLESLRKDGWCVVEPVCKKLACGETGTGALASPEAVVAAVKRVLLSGEVVKFESGAKSLGEFYKKRRVVVTGGATTEKIDDVRGITNFSSGKFARALADAFYFAGAEVCLVSSAVGVGDGAFYERRGFGSSGELFEVLCGLGLGESDILVMNAAVSDFVPEVRLNGKVKKGDFPRNLVLRENFDLLASFESPCKKVGFKMEFNEVSALANARESLVKKRLDAVCLNVLGGRVGFGSEETQVRFVTPRVEVETGFGAKSAVAFELVQLVARWL